MRWGTILSALIVMLVAGCDKPKGNWPKTQELRVNIKAEPLSLDPRKPNDVTSINFHKMCFDGLTRIGLDGKATPSIASHITVSEDQKIYTCVLKETFWSDGTPLTAYDFEKTWKTILDPAFPSEAASDLYVIKNANAAKINKCALELVGVRALDAHTLQIELDHPTPSFLSMLSTHAFYATPTHIVYAHPEWADKNGPYYVSNGPFSLKEWHNSDYMLLEKNEKYWDKANVKLDRMYLYLIDDETTELSLFENGDLDWAGSPLSSLPTDAMHALKHVHTYPMAGIYYYTINIKDPLLKNVNLRKALALAINRQEIIDNVTQSGQLVATAFTPPSLCPARHYFDDANIEGARKYFQAALKELGLSAEEFPTLTLSYNTMNAHHKIAQAIQGQWRKALGIRTRLENKEWKVYLDELRHHQYQIGRLGSIANNYEPISFFDRFRYLSSDENFGQWTNAEFTELLERGDAAIDPEARLCYLLKAEAIFMDEMPVIPIYFYTGSYLKKTYVQDVYISELADVDFKWAYVEMKQ